VGRLMSPLSRLITVPRCWDVIFESYFLDQASRMDMNLMMSTQNVIKVILFVLTHSNFV